MKASILYTLKTTENVMKASILYTLKTSSKKFDNTSKDDYRPISTLSNVTKLFTHLLNF